MKNIRHDQDITWSSLNLFELYSWGTKSLTPCPSLTTGACSKVEQRFFPELCVITFLPVNHRWLFPIDHDGIEAHSAEAFDAWEAFDKGASELEQDPNIPGSDRYIIERDLGFPKTFLDFKILFSFFV